MPHYNFEPVGSINSCFKEKFGIPRQPGIVSKATAILEIEPQFSQSEAFRHLETFSHIWIIFVFHQSLGHRWKTTVRPPRLGGNQRVGVFASRSGFRPNAIGQSAVKLISVDKRKNKIKLLLGGVDFLHGTPVLDIKPYLPYSDAISKATSGYAHHPPKPHWPVIFSQEAINNCKQLEQSRYPGLEELITDLLALDPRPGYRKEATSHTYGMRLWDLNIIFRFDTDKIVVDAITPY
jgi:tRNA (adenine37-N6)-methyltransferase